MIAPTKYHQQSKPTSLSGQTKWKARREKFRVILVKDEIMNGRPNKAYQSAADFQVEDQPWLSKESPHSCVHVVHA